MMIINQTELMRARKRALKGHLEGTQRAFRRHSKGTIQQCKQ